MPAPYLEVLTQRSSASTLLFQLNPWDLSGSENVNCPSAAAVVHRYLQSQGQTISQALSGSAFTTTPDPQDFRSGTVNFPSIIRRVETRSEGHCLVVHAIREGDTEHFFNLVNIDGTAWWVDAGVDQRFATAQRLQHLAETTNQMRDFSYTEGSFTARRA